MPYGEHLHIQIYIIIIHGFNIFSSLSFGFQDDAKNKKLQEAKLNLNLDRQLIFSFVINTPMFIWLFYL